MPFSGIFKNPDKEVFDDLTINLEKFPLMPVKHIIKVEEYLVDHDQLALKRNNISDGNIKLLRQVPNTKERLGKPF
ncbi:hypothetical protein C900_04732 [Fulvivirga imtechensis AK7]|uniref:Uncharacterized protein n=1 Tax=Fulvivirga imtechensis AK7 TaxID=1237149 RepID=L8JLU1_9BACT|nr:hypothetical protein C900_04732 [Fulvivirga imtechensis AK7]